jgi:hypothetical protein
MNYLILAALIGLIPAAIAHAKGQNFFGWWFFGAIFFILALPLAILTKTDHEALARRALVNDGLRKCPHCAELIRCEAIVCRFCGQQVEPVEPPPLPMPLRAGSETDEQYAARVARIRRGNRS